MHMLIRAIVYAKDEEGAIEQGRRVFEQLVDDKHFNYYMMFGTEEDNGFMSGTERWGMMPPVVRADSFQGQLLIERGMAAHEREMRGHIEVIRRRIDSNPTTEALIEDGNWRWDCYCVGLFRGYQVWLYDNDGEGIRDRKHLKNALDKWRNLYGEAEADPYAGLNVYVLPADVHH